jgi:hypothetical protein
VYADSVFFFNFAVTLSLLFLTKTIARVEGKPLRLLTSAAFGGAVSLLNACLFLNPLPALPLKVFSVAASAAIAFRASPRRLFKLFFLLFFLTFAFAGIFYMLFLFAGNSRITFFGGEFVVDIPLPLFAAVFGGMYLLSGRIMKLFSKKSAERLLRVRLGYRGVRYCLHVLSDTGSTLKEPLTGQDVLVVDKRILVIERGQAEYIVPYGTIAGDGMLYAAPRISFACLRAERRDGSMAF